MTARAVSALYRAALRALPADVRERHGDEMAAVFTDLVTDARRRRGVRGIAALTLAELAALAHFAWCERRGRPRPPRIDERQFIWPEDPEGRTNMLAALVQDTRYAARMLRRSPGFTVVATITMALAIGANTAIFSVVNGVLLKSLPYADPADIVVLGHHTNGGESLDSTTPGNLYDWMDAATAFESMGGFATTERILTWNGNAERVRGVVSVGSVFEVLGRPAARGRVLARSDDEPGAEPVIVLSSGFARRVFGEHDAVGRSLSVNGLPHTVIGVMPADFAFFDFNDEYWIPARFDAAFRNNRDQYFLAGIARLRSGITLAQAKTQVNTLMDAIRREYPQHTQNATAGVASMKDVLLDDTAPRLMMLMGAVGFVLLIACANLGNLLLARASTRRQEMAVRHALGARPGRLVRQMLTEGVLLALLGGIAGFALGVALLDALLALLPETLPRLKGVQLDVGVLLFTTLVSLLSGLAFGALPALQLVGDRGSIEAIRDGARVRRYGGWMRQGLIASELALALMLLVGAGLLGRSLAKLLDVPPGFRTDRLLTFAASVPPATYATDEQRRSFFERAAERLEALPGVRMVTLTTTLPVTGRGNGAWFNIIDRPLPATETPPGVPNRVVRANYFQALGIPLLKGRYFTEADGLHGTRAVIISESVARRFWPNEEALGRRIYMGAPDNRVVPDSEIVGIVADVKQTALAETRAEAVYVPHALVPSIANFTFALRGDTDPASLTSAVRAVMRELDPGVPLVRIQTMDTILARAMAPTRSSMLLVSLFAGVALTLAMVGVFGLISYSVTQRTPELGIRLALGATAGSVKLLVVRQGMVAVAAGVIIGIAGALGLTRFMEALLFGVTPTDPLTLVSVSLSLATVAAIASYIPARRATRVDPVTVLRQD